jgi:6-pyruvoyltetrahydropterin/6-carboxytetrahydropterin synthase
MVKWRISKTFEFSYSHVLAGLPEGHQCARLHGHNAVVQVVLESDRLNDVGFIVDYGELAPLKAYLDGAYDHRHLNDVVPFNPTAELLAADLLKWCKSLGWPVKSVGWSETPKTWAYAEDTE